MRIIGRLVNKCLHHAGWTRADGEQRCNACGTRRFTGYGALRPPGLPQVRTPSDEARARADRSAALLTSRTAYHLRRWRLSAAV
ncbi:DUF6255 family natural product biosynthesis protein [Streptomyces sp. NPDC026206]|uniref:DUF6255 family natural product biosynthesis protein n=1 Tax=Streptomyces sp. NPDC026206 TaxID=3157089 RepID=UPI0033D4EACE